MRSSAPSKTATIPPGSSPNITTSPPLKHVLSSPHLPTLQSLSPEPLNQITCPKNPKALHEIDMQVEGDTDDEKAKSLVRAMLEAGLAEKL